MRLNGVMKPIILIALASVGLVALKAPEEVTLNLTLSNIEKIEGKLYVAVIAKKDADGFPEDRKAFYKHVVRDVTSSEQQVTFNLPVGTYALAVLQDLNGNARMDKNFLGIPQEPYGFSNNFTPTIAAPDFEDCSFQLSSKSNHYKIRLIH